ncbi:hypothetical protein [Legionella drancourtii]|uniref:Uncharacterized protein n=1 Tax=Legionella drancourtii LLAP12 TaxID=658187 RepID=G9ELW8_9GAMM|nr:hypothetical protein [Legionella drancourtii]EHL31568.1 hypothetical protein LDG_6228 [Legionella drancourtii LLAP12]
MAANTNSNEIVNKIKNNPAPVILEQKELSSEIRNKIKSNPASAMLEQKELSEATIGILGSYLRGLRMSRGVLNKFDEKEQNAQIVRELKYISEHNYLLFLVLTRQYDRIHEIFFDKDLFARELALIAEIKREEARTAAKVQQQTPFFDPLKPQTTTTNTPTASSSYTPRDYSPFFTQGVTNMDLYRYYEQEYRRVSYAHYTAQTQVLDTAYHGRAARMMRAIDSLDENFERHHSIRREIKQMRQRYTEERDAIMSRSIARQDVHAAKKQYEDLLKLDQKYEKAFATVLEKNQNEPGFAEIYKEELEETQRYKEELESNDEVYAEKLAEITPHLERTNQAAKANIEENLNALIGDIGELPIDLLNKGQQQELNRAVSRLTALKEQVKDADSLEQKEELLAKCSQEVEIIKRIAYPLMTGQLKQQFEKDVDMFQKIAKDQDTLGLNAAPFQEDIVEAVAQAHAIDEIAEYELGAEIPKESLVNAQNSNLGHKIHGANHDIANQSSIEAQRRLKLSLHSSRDVAKNPDSSMDEKMNVINTTLARIATKLEGIGSEEELSDEDNMIISEINAQIREVTEYKNFEDLPRELIQSLSNNFDKLAANHEFFEEIKEKFAIVSELMQNSDEYSARQSVHI